MKYFKQFIVTLLLAVLFLVQSHASALSITVSAGATSATADNASTITFTVTEDGVPPGACDEVQPYATGSGNTISSSQFVLVHNGSNACTGTFTLKSSVAEAKTVGVKISGLGGYQPAGNSVDVTFTAVVVSPKPKTTTPAQTTQTPAEAPKPPAAPTTEFKLDNEAVATDTKPTVDAEGVILSGKTVANGVVTLYIFSTPKQATVTADANGYWSYEVTGLEPGDHHVEATVTDPTTNLTSERATLAAFTVAASPASTTAKATSTAKPTPVWVWFVVVGGVAAFGIGVWMLVHWLRRRRHTNLAPPANPTPPQETQVPR